MYSLESIILQYDQSEQKECIQSAKVSMFLEPYQLNSNAVDVTFVACDVSRVLAIIRKNKCLTA